MDRNEYINILGMSLKGKVDDEEYTKQLDYYNSYFDDEIASGRSEREIIDELGDPRLIAKTIVTTYGFNDDAIGRPYINETYSEDGKRYDGPDGIHETRGGFFSKIKRYAIIALAIIFVFIIIAAVFRLLSVLLPILFVFIIITVLLTMLRR